MMLGVAFLRAFLRGAPPRFPLGGGGGAGASSSEGSGMGCSGTSNVSGLGVVSPLGAGCSDVTEADRLRFVEGTLV
jgi:hypothetical protein